ncbi:MAG: TetR/AcrR family transcriptional regulator [Pseudomonadota bacterium]
MAQKEKQREEVIERLSAHLLETGLSKASLRQLAAAAGVSDRMLLYYFADKADVLACALGRVASDLTVMLDTAIPAGRKLPPAEIIRATTQLIREPASKPFFRLWTEAVAAAARHEAPFVEIARQIAEGFLVWIEDRLSGGTGETRRATAAMVLAMVDGLALLEICTDEERADSAASQMQKLQHPDFD